MVQILWIRRLRLKEVTQLVSDRLELITQCKEKLSDMYWCLGLLDCCTFSLRQ